MRVADSRSLSGFVFPLQHRKYDKPPHSKTPWSLDLRSMTLGVRVLDRMKGNGELGHYIATPEEVGDITGAVLWMRDKKGAKSRELSPFSFVYPAFVVADDKVKGEKFGRGGPLNVQVIRKPWATDDRLATLQTDIPPLTNIPPAGSLGIVVSAQEESEQLEVFISPQSQAAIIAPWRGGTEKHGTIVYDLTDKAELDPLKNGRIQHHIRVTHSMGKYQPALNTSQTAKNGPGGFGLCWGVGDGGRGPTDTKAAGASPGVAHWLSWEKKGPIHPGHASADKHKAGTNADGEPEQPSHIWIEALYYKDKIEDGPLNHTKWQQGGKRQVPTKVQFGWNGSRWDWWTTTPIIPPPWIPWEPPTDKVPPVIVPNPRTQLPPGGGSGVPTGGGRPTPVTSKGKPGFALPPSAGGAGGVVGVPTPQPKPGEPTGPTPGNPANPPLHEQELAVQSLVILGTRDRDTQGGQGGYGGDGGDTVFLPPQPGPSLGGPLFPFAPFGGGIPIPPIGSEGFPPTDPPFDLDTPGAETNGQLTPEEQRLRDARRTGANAQADEERRRNTAATRDMQRTGRVGNITAAAIERGGPTPMVGHIVGVAQVKSDGTWRYAAQPAANVPKESKRWGNGTAAAGAMYLGPMVIPDGKNDQTEWLGDVDVLVYQGFKGGTPSRFGWGYWNQQAAQWRDGMVTELTGASDAWDAKTNWRDAAGVYRTGTLEFNGIVRGGTDVDGANIGMGRRAVTAIPAGAGTTLLTVGTDEQLQRFTFTAGGAPYTYNLDLDNADAEEGTTFELDLELAVTTPGNSTTVLIRNGSGGATLATTVSAISGISGIIKRWAKAYFDGTNWVLTALVANLT